jgi:hypothetical protein
MGPGECGLQPLASFRGRESTNLTPGSVLEKGAYPWQRSVLASVLSTNGITLEDACGGGAVALLSIYFLDLVGITTLKPSSRIVLCVVDINGMLPALGICRRVHEQVPAATVREVFRGLALIRSVHVRGVIDECINREH